MKEVSLGAAVGIILLSLGVYQIIAALLAIFFWMVAGDWRDFISQIIVIAFWINLPVTYWIWQRRLHAGEKRIDH
ncbi:MAG TPA: hypothetical protein VE136_12970 [Anaerolineales bacterium]|nr:hypothetical protein [Anaerolineales bacterium]